jgi:hypothetical protein
LPSSFSSFPCRILFLSQCLSLVIFRSQNFSFFCLFHLKVT